MEPNNTYSYLTPLLSIMILRFTYVVVSSNSFFVLWNSTIMNILQFVYSVFEVMGFGSLQFGAMMNETIKDLLVHVSLWTAACVHVRRVLRREVAVPWGSCVFNCTGNCQTVCRGLYYCEFHQQSVRVPAAFLLTYNCIAIFKNSFTLSGWGRGVQWDLIVV